MNKGMTMEGINARMNLAILGTPSRLVRNENQTLTCGNIVKNLKINSNSF